MEASILDLRYRMKDILKALDRNEVVKILYHGKLKGSIIPCKRKTSIKASKHPYFNSQSSAKLSVEQQMQNLRGDRYSDL